jgi:predicted RNA-binding Zn-ribbon protein involved in translation (DUF1610 family)
MKIAIIVLIWLVLMGIIIGYDIYSTRFCKNCGTRMNRHYDIEEDAEVYQCPCCGRSYLIK